MTDKNSERRRWFQLRLRTLLIVVLVLSLLLSWFGARFRKARRQSAAVETLGQLGGWAEYDWMRCQLFSLHTLLLSGTQIGDAEVAHIGKLVNLQRLWLDRTQTTDSGLEHLDGLTSLVVLSLGETEVSDAGLEHLMGMTKLALLSVANTNVTDEGVKNLQEALPNCKIDH